MEGLREAVKRGLAFKGQDSMKNPPVLFFLKLNKSLPNGWMQSVICPDSKEEHNLTEGEHRMVGYLGMSYCFMKGVQSWEKQVGRAFGIKETMVKQRKNEFFSVLCCRPIMRSLTTICYRNNSLRHAYTGDPLQHTNTGSDDRKTKILPA